MASTSSNINEYPNVTLTYAQSIDGSIAGIAGKRLRLSGMESMKYTHELRAANQGILIGVNTLLADNPSLTVRMCPGNSPQPVILDSNLRIPTTCKLLTNEKCIKPIILYCCDTENNDENNKKLNQLNQLGCICIKSKSHDGHVDLDDGLKLIKKKPHDINTLMVEGGGQVITNFMRLHCDQNIGFSRLWSSREPGSRCRSMLGIGFLVLGMGRLPRISKPKSIPIEPKSFAKK